MSHYDFRSLSPYEFEDLARDLLQKELGSYLESFKRGRDKGIDLRAPGTVVQCKHYVDSGYAKLLSHLKNIECAKVRRLAPKRYILATSVGLTPDNKDQLAELLAPYCNGPQDIFGAGDLNNLLGRYPEVEKSHFKLWLTSSEVLRTLLTSDLYNETLAERRRIEQRLRLYVQHNSYFEAAELLEHHNYCIIAGQPGIGKTTLAEALTVAHLGQGYEVVVLSDDIRDAFRAYDGSRPQLFVYDDFLGTTALEATLHKNEDVSLIRLVEHVQRTPDCRLILTTRELVLNQAKATHEKLAASNIDVARCTITVTSYTPLQRAAILHNHVWFSSLPSEYKRALLRDRSYRRILAHKNYIPRIIEWMTAPSIVAKVKPDEYVARFLEYLDHPHDLWRHAFEQQLSERARHLLCVVATMPVILISDLEPAFQAYRASVCQEYGIPRSPSDFRQAIRELEEAFLAVEQVTIGKAADAIVRVHHPSVTDFLEAHLQSSPRELGRLAQTATAFEQLGRVWAMLRASKVGLSEPLLESVWGCAERLLDAPAVRVERNAIADLVERETGPHYYRVSGTPESRLRFLHSMASEVPCVVGARVMAAQGAAYYASLQADRRVDSETARLLLESLSTRPVEIGVSLDELRSVVKAQLLDDFAGVDDLECLGSLAVQNPGAFSEGERCAIEVDIGKLVRDIAEDGGSSSDTLEALVAAVESIRDSLDIDVRDSLERLDERLREIEAEKEEHADFDYDSMRDAALDSEQEERAIDAMFEVFAEEEDVAEASERDDHSEE